MSLLLLFGGGVAPVTSTGTWAQPVAAWAGAGISAEDIIGDGAWSQTATWAGTASESIPSTGTWTQTASWEGTAVSAEDIFAEGAWEQVATWGGTAETPIQAPPGIGISRVQRIPKPRPKKVTANAAFAQDSASWEATGRVNDDNLVLLILES